MEGEPIAIPEFLQECPNVSTSGVSSNLQDDTNAAVTELATREPSNSQYTLAEMLQSPRATSPWDGNYVADKYRNIIQDVIEELSALVKPPCVGRLTLDDIYIVNDRAKININILNPSNTENLPTYRDEFRTLVTKILGSDNSTSVELKHFYHMVDKTQVALGDLLHHPLLMSSNERLYFPIDAIPELQSKTGDAWKGTYNDGKKIDIETTIVTSTCDPAFKSFYEKDKAKYPDNALGVLDYSRDIISHPKQINSEKVLEEGLTSLFPKRLTYLYDFLRGKGIRMQSIIQRRAES
ncbi:uncharacterized protein LOC110754858 isoform X2 [Prunus avium]|uniref:Uncharacterized protein LOC110754858 isoform X2 n=1 Tax=Prunus avium TaxID=42229 RepID=A0A6P5SB79_PRUAV|nr:uncharacterized protein LOC110754858 isoform X2 [Prunus avium]